MKRLYLKIYLGVLGVALGVMIAMLLVGWLALRQATGGDLGARMEALRELSDAELGARLRASHWGRGPGVAGQLVALAFFCGAIALGVYPVSRRLAARLERLRASVERLGGGDLGARVPVEGRDEVAELALALNRSAARIEQLVQSERRMLASASHELRTPLARLRVALELLGREPRPELLAEACRDVAELDELIGDLLLTSSLQAGVAEPRQPIALDTIVCEEAARQGARCEAEPTTLVASPREIRRLVRNLLQNAKRHAGGTTEVELETTAYGARLRVADRGPGVPEAERERIFEPFYRRAGHSEGEHGGVGLGLALVREIARHYQGDARCLPREGGGTIFEVELRARES